MQSNLGRILVSLPLVLLLWLAAGERAAAQFGKNKVQYRTFDWKYIQSDHFDIYFYDSAGVTLAKFTAHVAEHALRSLEENWRYRVPGRIAIVLYNSHNDFQQTNVIGEFLPEGVGGVTELFKNRVAVPFEGDWEKFRHVIHHELVHAVINEKFYGGSLQALISSNVRFMLPLWMNEGLAEFESQDGYDVETDMFIRDAVLNGYLPPLERLDGYFAYRGGQAFYWYVEQTYGRDKIAELLNRARTAGSLDGLFRSTFGVSLEEFSEQWVYDLKKIYYPDIADRQRPRDVARPLTDHRDDGSFFNTSPSLSPGGERLAWISDRDGYRSVYVMEVDRPGSVEKVAQGEENVDFEELHLLTPAIAWSPDGRRISLSAKARGRDVIYVLDVDEGDRERIELDLDAIYSVDWSPDGRRLAFQGIKGEMTDIYLYDLTTNELTNLTSDIFTDAEPAWSAGGDTLYFTSDRRDHALGSGLDEGMQIWNYDYDTRDLFALDLRSNALARLTRSDSASEHSPEALPDGSLLYISDANGIQNVWLRATDGSSRPLTNSISGIEQLTATRDGGLLAFTAWNGDGQDVFLLRSPTSARLAGDTLAPTTFLGRSRVTRMLADSVRQGSVEPVTAVTNVGGYGDVRLDLADAVAAAPSTGRGGTQRQGRGEIDQRVVTGDFSVLDYKVKFTPDFIQASGNYSSFYGVQGVTQMLFSDMLGDHQIYVATSLLLDLKNSDFLVSYAYLPERIDYSIDAFHSSRFVGLYDGEENYALTRFRQFGLAGSASNPFDRFRRLDLGLSMMRVSREPIDVGTVEPQSKWLVVPRLSYVFDNTRMWAFNPASGSRYYVAGQASPKLGDEGVGFYTVMADLRHYIPLSRYGEYSIGARLAGGASFGSDPQKFYVGGTENWLNWEVRDNELPIENAEDYTFVNPGYPLRGFRLNEQLGSNYLLGNLELRFPLFQALVTGPLPVLFQYVSGVMYLDAGSAWSGPWHPFGTDQQGAVVTDQLLLGSGLGARAYVFGLPIKFDVAWRYDLESWSRPTYYFSLGYDF